MTGVRVEKSEFAPPVRDGSRSGRNGDGGGSGVSARVEDDEAAMPKVGDAVSPLGGDTFRRFRLNRSRRYSLRATQHNNNFGRTDKRSGLS